MNNSEECRRTIWHFPKSAYAPQGYLKQESFDPEIIQKATKRCTISNVGPICSKVILVGDVGVGKTTLVNRFCRSTFSNDYKATIGVDFEVEEFSILGCKFHLQIWDTSGQEKFRSLGAAYYRGARAILIVFDLTDKESLDSAVEWGIEALKCNGNETSVLLIGTKKDLTKEYWRMAESSAQDTAEKMRAELWCTSSKTGENVCELFHRVAALTFEDCLNNPIPGFSGLMKKEYWRMAESSAQDTAEKMRAELWCTSSKTGENVCELFHRVAALTFEDCLNNPIPGFSGANENIHLVDAEFYEKKSSPCGC